MRLEVALDDPPSLESTDVHSAAAAMSQPFPAIDCELELLLPLLDLEPCLTMTLECSVRTAISPSRLDRNVLKGWIGSKLRDVIDWPLSGCQVAWICR